MPGAAGIVKQLIGPSLYSGGRTDLVTGDVWPETALGYAKENDLDGIDDPDRWLWVHSEGSRPGYRDMELFISEIDDPEIADRLEIVISGRGAFRRFRGHAVSLAGLGHPLERLLRRPTAGPRASLARR